MLLYPFLFSRYMFIMPFKIDSQYYECGKLRYSESKYYEELIDKHIYDENIP